MLSRFISNLAGMAILILVVGFGLRHGWFGKTLGGCYDQIVGTADLVMNKNDDALKAFGGGALLGNDGSLKFLDYAANHGDQKAIAYLNAAYAYCPSGSSVPDNRLRFWESRAMHVSSNAARCWLKAVQAASHGVVVNDQALLGNGLNHSGQNN